MLEATEVVDGRYRVVRLLGRGGMSEVYRAERLDDGSAVALKLIDSHNLTGDKAIERFRREAELSRRIDHPNVVTVFEVLHVDGRAGELPCMVLEFLDGHTLADHLHEHGRMSLREARPIVDQIAAALSAAHAVGVIHRDLKPDNIFLVGRDGTSRVVLTDFGVARSADEEGPDLTATHVIPGTPEYMAPEQLELETASSRSDLYTLGLVMYEMVTGRAAFTGSSPLEAVFARVKDDPEPPRKHVADLPLAWDQTIMRCLERDPAKRFATAESLVASLDAEGMTTSYRWVLIVVALVVIALMMWLWL
ncbi:MAG: serine/threonine-protein kinase [Acidobacteriota bacterium]